MGFKVERLAIHAVVPRSVTNTQRDVYIVVLVGPGREHVLSVVSAACLLPRGVILPDGQIVRTKLPTDYKPCRAAGHCVHTAAGLSRFQQLAAPASTDGECSWSGARAAAQVIDPEQHADQLSYPGYDPGA